LGFFNFGAHGFQEIEILLLVYFATRWTIE